MGRLVHVFERSGGPDRTRICGLLYGELVRKWHGMAKLAQVGTQRKSDVYRNAV
jgi:hypothetical protein